MTQPVVPPPPVPAPVTTAAPAAEERVRVLDKVGRPGSIPRSQLESAKAQGFVEDTRGAANQSVYEDAIARGFSPTVARGIAAASPFLSYEQGTVEGATAGIGSAIQRKIAGVIGPVAAKALGGPDMTQDEAEKYYRQIAQGGAHSTLHGVGQLAGFAGSSVAAGPLRAAGGAAGGLGRGLGLLSAAGQGAARGAAGLTAGLAARGALGRAASTGAQMAAQGALEMGIYDGVRELSEEVFGDPKLSAEKVLAAAADGAYGGALMGGALGAGGSLVKSGALGARNIATGVLSKNADALQNAANEQRWRALVPKLKYTKEAEARLAGGASGGGEVLGRYGLTGNTFAEAAREGDVASILPKLDDALTSVGQKIGEARGASTATIPWSSIDDAIEKVAAPLRKSHLLDDKLAKVEQMRTSLARDLIPGYDEMMAMRGATVTAEEAAGLQAQMRAMREAPIPLQQVVERRQILDDLFYQETKTLDPNMRVQLMRDLRGHLENTIMNSFDDAARAAGDTGARAALEGLKHDYQALSLARNAARDATASGASNRMVSLSDYVTMAGFGGGVKGALAAGANRFLRTRGNAVAAVALDKLAAAGGRLRQGAAAAEVAAPGLAGEASAAAREFGPASPGEELLSRRAALGEELGEAPVAPALRDIGAAPVRREVPRPADFTEPFPERPPLPEAPPAFTKPKPEVTASAAGEESLESFERRVTDASWANENKDFGGGMVDMGRLRKEFPELSREEFDRKILELDRAGKISLKNADDPRRWTDDMRENTLWMERRIPGSEPEQKGYHWVLPHSEPSGVPWKRATSAGDAELKAWEAEKAASEQAHAEYAQLKKAHGADYDRAVSEWEQRSNAWVDAEDSADAAQRMANAEFEAASAKWHAERAAAETEYADMVAKAAQYDRVKEAIAHVDEQIDKAASGLVTPVERPASAPSEPKFKAQSPYRPGLEAHESLRTQFDHARETVVRMQEMMANNVKPTGLPDMPKISEAMAAQTARTVAYLSNQIPQPLGEPMLGDPLPSAVTDSDMHAFLEKYKAAIRPGEAFRQFARGIATPEQVEAVRFVTPEMFARLQVKTLDQLRASKDVPFEMRQNLSFLLGIPTDPSQDPAMATMLRGVPKGAGMGPNQGMGPSAPAKGGGGRSRPVPPSLGLGRYDRLGTRTR